MLLNNSISIALLPNELTFIIKVLRTAYRRAMDEDDLVLCKAIDRLLRKLGDDDAFETRQ